MNLEEIVKYNTIKKYNDYKNYYKIIKNEILTMEEMSMKTTLKRYGSREGIARRAEDSKLRKDLGSRGMVGGMTMMPSSVIKIWAAHDASVGHNKIYIVYILKVGSARFEVKALYGAITRDKLSRHNKGVFSTMSSAQSKAIAVFMEKLNKGGYEDIESAAYKSEVNQDSLRRWIVAEEFGVVEASEKEKAGLTPCRCSMCNKFFMGDEGDRYCDMCKEGKVVSKPFESAVRKPEPESKSKARAVCRLGEDGSIVSCLDGEGIEDGFLVGGEYVGFECDPQDRKYIRVMDKFGQERICKRSRFKVVPE